MGDGSGRLQCWCYVVGKLCRLMGSSHCLTDTTALVAPATGKLELVFLVICNQHSKSPGCWNGRKGIKEDFFSPCCTSCVCYAKVYVGTNHISQPQWWEAILPLKTWPDSGENHCLIPMYHLCMSQLTVFHSAWESFLLLLPSLSQPSHQLPTTNESTLSRTRFLLWLHQAAVPSQTEKARERKRCKWNTEWGYWLGVPDMGWSQLQMWAER